MKKSVIKVIGLVVSILISLLFVFTFIQGEFLRSLITKDVEAYGPIFFFLISVFLDVSPQYIGPDLLMVDLLLLGFSPWPIIIAALAGSIVGSVIGFELGKRYGMHFVKSLSSKEEMKKMQKRVDEKGKWIMLLAAITPIPYFPVLFGSLNFSRKEFWIYGIIPRAIEFIVLGFFFSGYFKLY